MNRPSVLLSLANSRSPCRTWISTWLWLSDAVENTWLLLVGIVVLRSMSRVMTPPRVSMPSESGVTSSSRTSLTSPASTPAWIAAPIATTSSGLTPLWGSLPLNIALTASTTAGMRVWPPTRITSSISPGFRPGVLEGGLHRPRRLVDQVPDEVLELGARERHHEVLRARLVGRDVRAG